MKKDRDIASIISFITFDGHLMKDLSGFYFCSKDLDTLRNFEKLFQDKFGMKGYFEKGQGYGTSYKLRFFNSHISKQLFEIGAPKGNKVLACFSVPAWIKQNDAFSKRYLRTAFDCEGSIWKEKNRFCIKFGIFKDVAFLADGIAFVRELKVMLNKLGIQTTRDWVVKGNIRKDGVTTKGIYFKIMQKAISAFATQVGFNDRFKNQRLISWLGQIRLPSTGS